MSIYSLNSCQYNDVDKYWNEEVDLNTLDVRKLSDAGKLTIIRDCIVIANIDNEYAERERQKIFQIASRIGIQTEKVLEIEVWLQEYWKVLRKGIKIFSRR